MLIEGWSASDALYMTVITVTTLGFAEVHPLSAGGRWFTMVLALGGIFGLFFAASSVLALAVTGDLARIGREFMIDRKLASLEGHVIVCGSGRMGRFVTRALLRQQMSVVVIDTNPDALVFNDAPSALSIRGDASSDDLLIRVGIRKARALVAALGDEAHNVFVTLTARALNAKLFIVARATEEATESKLTRAGADRVVSPFSVGGYVAANAILHPTVLDTLDLTKKAGHLELQIEEVVLRAGTSLGGRRLSDLRARLRQTILVVALRRASGELLFNPSDETVAHNGDTLVVMGDRTALDQVERLAMGSPNGDALNLVD